MAPVEITTRVDGRNLISSGVVIIKDEQEISVELKDGSERVVVIFDLVTVQDAESNIESKLIDGSTLRFKLVNMGSLTGQSIAPITIGTLDDRSLSMAFAIYRIGASRQFYYSFFLGDREHGKT